MGGGHNEVAEFGVRDGEEGGGVFDFGGRQAEFGGVVEVAEGVVVVIC
jgi:hypothetical protein